MSKEVLAAQLQRFMVEAQLTPTDVHRALGVSDSAVGHWISGRHPPTVANLVAFMDLVGRRVAFVRPDLGEVLDDLPGELEGAAVECVGALRRVEGAPERRDLLARIAAMLPRLRHAEFGTLTALVGHFEASLPKEADDLDNSMVG